MYAGAIIIESYYGNNCVLCTYLRPFPSRPIDLSSSVKSPECSIPLLPMVCILHSQ